MNLEKEGVPMSPDQSEHSAIFAEIRNISVVLGDVRTQLREISDRLRANEMNGERINGRLELGTQKFSMIDDRLRLYSDEIAKHSMELVKLHAAVLMAVTRDTLEAKMAELNKTIDTRADACITKESLRWLLAGATAAGGAMGGIAGKLIGMF